MKIRLTAPGFEHYDGQMGVLFFEDGLSITDCSHLDATRIAAVIGAEWEDGTPANVSQIYLDHRETGADMVPDGLTQHPIQPEVVVETQPLAPVVTLVTTDKPVETPHYTEDELASIDSRGIAGLREIATPMGIKGTSIGSLISQILHALSEQDITHLKGTK